MKKVSRSILLIYILFSGNLIIAQTGAAETALRARQFNIDKSDLALQGYDPMSYFLGHPQKGTSTYTFKYKGITYLFASAKNMELFKSAPQKFEPAYGGWCAYAMGATGEKVEIDPATYKIVNGRLYLFYNSLFNNTLPKWNADEAGLNKKADANWIKIYK